ncbi:arabinose-proton symporter [Naematelia encephala]|uniref:Arabinose-proton symporter n=1 Tax=Naematelia encephala TaxID=71784 RepID=A0A1Y2B6M0_9TREE|nr:arabinose-proton symporter [Naematelia encephala]
MSDSYSILQESEVDKFQFHPDVKTLVHGDSTEKSYGKASVAAFFSSPYVMMCSAAATLGGFLFGIDQGLISIILGLPRFLKLMPEIDATVSSDASFNKGLMTGILELGAALGALQSGYAADKISRRYVLLLGAAWFTIGSVLQTSAFHFAQLVVGRFIGGVGIGTLSCVAPLFIGEIAPPHLRGAMLVFESWMVVIGIVVAFYVTYGTRHLQNEWAYRLPFLLQMVPGFILAALVFVLPFSPRWLALRGRNAEALNTLSRLRRLPISDPRVQAEWVAIRAEVASNKIAQDLRHPSLADGSGSGLRREVLTWMDCFRPGIFRRTIIGIGLQFFQQFIGVNAIVYYSPTLFGTLGYNYETQLTYSGITNVMQLAGVTPTFFLMDRLGRRPLLLCGSVICFACHMIIGSVTAAYYKDWPSHPAGAKLGVAMLMIFMFSFGVSWCPIPWAVPPEVTASSYRSKSVALAVVSNWANNFIIGLIVPVLVQKTHGYGAFFFFAAFSAGSWFFVYFLVPETMGVSLEDMDAKFHSHTGQEDELRKVSLLNAIVSGGTAPMENTNDTPPADEKHLSEHFDYA